jgi:hypothetical protein
LIIQHEIQTYTYQVRDGTNTSSNSGTFLGRVLAEKEEDEEEENSDQTKLSVLSRTQKKVKVKKLCFN